MELDELKNKWRQLDEHVKSQDEKIRQLTDQVIAGKVKSPLTTLRRHCIIAAVAVPFLLPFFFWTYSFVGLTCGETQKTLLYALTCLFASPTTHTAADFRLTYPINFRFYTVRIQRLCHFAKCGIRTTFFV